jgi:4-carboxymuconolactone decarboxylase
MSSRAPAIIVRTSCRPSAQTSVTPIAPAVGQSGQAGEVPLVHVPEPLNGERHGEQQEDEEGKDFEPQAGGFGEVVHRHAGVGDRRHQQRDGERNPAHVTSREDRAIILQRRGEPPGRKIRSPARPGRTHRMARLPEITSPDQVPAAGRAAAESIVKSRGALHGPFSMFLHSPDVAGRIAHVGAYVRFEGSLDMRVRVLAAMTVARELDAVYVWGAQTGGARRQGVPETTITAIRENHSRGIPPEDAQIVDFTRQLMRKHRVDDATVKALRQRFGDDGFIQLTGAIGYYSMLAMTVNACELEAGAGAEVLRV